MAPRVGQAPGSFSDELRVERFATGTMGYKHHAMDIATIQAGLSAPNYLLKLIPHVDGNPRICELVEYYREDIDVKGAWTGPAALSLIPHALAPVAELPVLEVVAATHCVADLTLGLGKVVLPSRAHLAFVKAAGPSGEKAARAFRGQGGAARALAMQAQRAFRSDH